MKRLLLLIFITTALIALTALTLNAEVVSEEGRLPFKDVSKTAWYYEAVTFSYLNGYMAGTSPESMMPSSTLTREAAVTILARMSGDDLTQYREDSIFLDVKNRLWYTREVNWAYDKGYISGMTPDRFGVGEAMTREQFARVLWLYLTDRYGEAEISDSIQDYSDADSVSEWAYDAICFCVSEGLIQGTSPNTLSPRALITRAQMAVLVKNIILVYSDCDHRFSKPGCTIPAYCYYCNIKTALPNGHRSDTVTCTNGGKCKNCNYYFEPDPQKHNYSSPTCTNGSTCLYCKITLTGPLGHSFMPATCTTPQICSRCKLTEGKALGHTSYNQACQRCGSYNYRTKILSVPYIDQRNNWPHGCEAVSTVMTLKYHGVNITVDEFINGYMPIGDAPENGHGPDPNEVYCGNPYTKDGWGCFSPAIVKSLNSLLVPQYWRIEHSYTLSLPTLCDKYIDKNIPVIIWATVNMSDASASYNYTYWYTNDGKRITYNRSLHCLVLVGYDKENYYFNDPINPGDGTNYVAYPKAQAEAAYKLLGQQSIAFYYTENN